MEEFRELLEQILNENLLQLVFSGVKNPQAAVKIKVRPMMVKQALVFQAAFWDGKKEKHINYEKQELVEAAALWMQQDYKQMQADTTELSASVLVSKKGKVTVKKRKLEKARQAAELSHNRKKRYVLEEGIPVPFLVELGVMTPEGRVVNSKYDKFRQINRFLEFIEDILPKLDKSRESVIIDFGCGKSYLTFAMYYYLKELKGYPVRIIGLDLKEDVIKKCNDLAVRYGYEKLSFYPGDIASYEGVDHVDMVVTLHACDVATDYALEKAVRWGAKVILSVPCCQHELNGQMENDLMKPIFQYGIIKERTAALYTDALRAQILESVGYRTQILEFIDMEHTPKNLLIRAVKQGSPKDNKEEIEAIMKELHIEPMLYKLLK